MQVLRTRSEEGVRTAQSSEDHLVRAPEKKPPRSDVGTIVLHWTLTIAILFSLATGLRLSADAETSIFAKALDPILPQGEIWTPTSFRPWW